MDPFLEFKTPGQASEFSLASAKFRRGEQLAATTMDFSKLLSHSFDRGSFLLDPVAFPTQSDVLVDEGDSVQMFDHDIEIE